MMAGQHQQEQQVEAATTAPFALLERNWRRVASTHTLQVGGGGKARVARRQRRRAAAVFVPERRATHRALMCVYWWCLQDLLDADKPAPPQQGVNWRRLALG